MRKMSIFDIFFVVVVFNTGSKVANAACDISVVTLKTHLVLVVQCSSLKRD